MEEYIGAISCSSSMIACLVIYHIISPRVSRRYSASYRTSPRDDKVQWNANAISLSFSIVCSVMSVADVFICGAMSTDPVWGTSTLVKANTGLTLGYMLADLVLMAAEARVLFEGVFVLHHAVVILGCSVSLTYGIFGHLLQFRFLHEISTVAWKVTWFMRSHGVAKSSWLLKSGALAFTVSFAVFRIATIPLFWAMFYHCATTAAVLPTWHLMTMCLVGNVTTDCLNLYWLVPIIKGIVKILKNETPEAIGNEKLE